jgi:UDP-3-O-acyl N-acetylglucosamine deacetylase
MPRWTVARPAELAGIGLHTGAEVCVRVEPAPPGQGIVFYRRDLAGSPVIPARLEAVSASGRRTVLGTGACRVETVEHLLAATGALALDDLTVSVDGPELPIGDGSFMPWLGLLDQAGRKAQAGRPAAAGIAAVVELSEGEARYRIEPADDLTLDVTLVYDHPVIGHQRSAMRVTEQSFRAEVAGARTYGMAAEVNALQGSGLLQGATTDCAIVLSATAVLNTALRWPDEFARHKLGDLLGDLTLLGARLHARVAAERPSHRGNLACVRALAPVLCPLEATS